MGYIFLFLKNNQERIIYWSVMFLIAFIERKYHLITWPLVTLLEKLGIEPIESYDIDIDSKNFIKEDEFIEKEIKDNFIERNLEEEAVERHNRICFGVFVTIFIFCITGIIYLDNLE